MNYCVAHKQYYSEFCAYCGQPNFPVITSSNTDLENFTPPQDCRVEDKNVLCRMPFCVTCKKKRINQCKQPLHSNKKAYCPDCSYPKDVK